MRITHFKRKGACEQGWRMFADRSCLPPQQVGVPSQDLGLHERASLNSLTLRPVARII